MAEQIEQLSVTLTKQVETFREMSTHYKLLKQAKLSSAFDSLQLVFTKINNSYVQIQRMISEVFKPLNKQFSYEMHVVDTRLNDIKTVHTLMLANEKKLNEKKNVLFEQQLIPKWELAPDCTLSMDELFTNRIAALREILPGESKECGKMRMLHGYMCNKIVEEFQRLCERSKEQVLYSILFVAKMSRDSAKDVFFDSAI